MQKAFAEESSILDCFFIKQCIEKSGKFWYWLRSGCGCRLKSSSPLVEVGTIGGMSFVGIFLRDPNPYLHEFRKKPRKIPKYG